MKGHWEEMGDKLKEREKKVLLMMVKQSHTGKVRQCNTRLKGKEGNAITMQKDRYSMNLIF